MNNEMSIYAKFGETTIINLPDNLFETKMEDPVVRMVYERLKFCEDAGVEIDPNKWEDNADVL